MMIDPQSGILLVRLKSMGDIIFTLPAVHALRESFPKVRMTFLISKEYARLLDGFPEVTSRIELDRGRFRGLKPFGALNEAFSLFRQMRREKLDLAIDFQGYGETAFLTWASGARQRWGTVYRPGRKWAYTCAVPRDSTVHPAEDYLTLLRQNGLGVGSVRNDFSLPKDSQEAALQFLSSSGLRGDRPTLFIQPFTSAPQKNWPISQYLEVAQHYRQQNWQVLFGGGPADRSPLEPVRAAGYPVAAGVPLLVSAGLAKLSSLVLGGDTGLLHLAVSLRKRVVMIMRTLRPGSTHPFQHKDWAIGPRRDGQIELIDAKTVLERLDQARNTLRNAP
jgi:ADP-heptose:LPS heptosyltransferase